VSGSPPAFKQIAAGWNHTCGVTTAGVAMCWGNYWNGRLGSSASSHQSAPVAVSAPSSGSVTYASVTAGMLHSCGITTSSQIFCWGSLGGVQFGIPNEVAKHNGASWSTMSLGGTAQQVCATNSSNLALCWGEASQGQLGNNQSGTMPNGLGLRFATPQLVLNGSGGAFSPALVSTATGEGHSCGLSAAGNAFCWGTNGNGQLGDGSQVQRNTPVAAGALTFTRISVGITHTCAIDANQDIYCWGQNTWGQLGIGTRNTMLPFIGANGVASPTKVVAPVQ
jgi:alpha-tubulin suppressor-like RCC1 family protein